MITRFKERTEDGFVIHAGPSSGLDVTLCGYALEGEAATHGGMETPVEVFRGKINCPACVNLILYCKSIPSTKYDASARE